MRILHTSDWHLGRSLGEHRLLDDQAAYGDWLVDVAAEEGIDLVVVAGDLFDRSVPPTDAWELLWDTFRRLSAGGAVVAAIAGNHDSADRLGATDGVTDRSGVYLRGGFAPASTVTGLEFADGPLALVTTPFLDPQMAPVEPGERRPTHEAVLAAALDRARAALPAGTRSLVVSHAFVTGAARSDSERDLAVGEAGLVSADVYRGFDYVALGHLHRPQLVDGRPHVRYSGSPLAYSFSETAPKEVVVVDLAPDGTVVATPRAVAVGRGVLTVRGELEALCAGGGDARRWVRAELTDAVRPVDAARRLRAAFPHLAEVEWLGARSHQGPGVCASEVRAQRPADLAAAFWTEVTGAAPEPEVLEILADSLAPEAAREAAA